MSQAENDRLALMRFIANKIRDDVQPMVVEHGTEALTSELRTELERAFSVFEEHCTSVKLEELQTSRLHRALMLVASKDGPSWPEKLAQSAGCILSEWTKCYGDLNEIRPLLYEKGGRLENHELERIWGPKAVVTIWTEDPLSPLTPGRALRHGHLGFESGEWWIHTVFAFYDGIIDDPGCRGGISFDDNGAYAILVNDNDEVRGGSFDNFIYRCRPTDPGRHRLVRQMFTRKAPVRVLRSYTLVSKHAPVAGVRYDGLYRISSLAVRTVDTRTVFEVSLLREAGQRMKSMVEEHPIATERDDFEEYYNLQKDMRRPSRADMSRWSSSTESGKLSRGQDIGTGTPVED